VPEEPKRAPPEKKVAVPKREAAPPPKGILKSNILSVLFDLCSLLLGESGFSCASVILVMCILCQFC